MFKGRIRIQVLCRVGAKYCFFLKDLDPFSVGFEPNAAFLKVDSGSSFCRFEPNSAFFQGWIRIRFL